MMPKGKHIMISATFTNAITNGLHAFFLFLYFAGALTRNLRKDGTFSFMLTLFFLTLFVMKLLGVYVHYYPALGIPPPWVAISLLTIMLNYLVTHAMEMPSMARIGVVFLSVFSAFMFISRGGFLYIALSVLAVYLICACYSRAWVRTGFLMIAGSNVAWILARQIGNWFLGHQVPIECRYDNDIYHLLLIGSTFVLYKGIARGDWRHPHDRFPAAREAS